MKKISYLIGIWIAFTFSNVLFAGQNVANPSEGSVSMPYKTRYTNSWQYRDVRLIEHITGYTPVTDGADDFTKYGSYKHLRVDSTGFYRVEKINDRWWVIDPDGYAQINMAVTSFESSSQFIYDICRRNGYNGAGTFIANESQTRDMYNQDNFNNFSYTRRLNFFLKYKNNRHNFYPETPSLVQGSHHHITVLDPHFAVYCDEIAQEFVEPFKDDRDMLGWFTDNEINFNQDQLRNLVADLPEGDPSREAALAFAADKGITEQQILQNSSQVTEAIKQEFAVVLARHYFKTVAEAIQKYDTNHLILGSRFHGRPRGIQGVVDASHEFMDVTSVNFYDRFAPNDQIAKPEWTNDHPTIIGEMYIKDINVYNFAQPGAGFFTDSQQHRGYFYQNTCLELLENKDIVGWHYFRFRDDPDSNKGMISFGSDWHEWYDMTMYMEQFNKQVYQIIDHVDGESRRPDNVSYNRIVTASEDTYVITNPDSDQNYNDAEELEVYYYWSANGRKEAFFKFNLSEIKQLLPTLKNATLELYATEANGQGRALYASGINDDSWNAADLTGLIQQQNPEWSSDDNRISHLRKDITEGKLAFDVTIWLNEFSNDSVFSFKIHDLLETNNPLKIASTKHPEQNFRPKLKLWFWGEGLSDDTSADNNLYYNNNIKWFADQNNHIHVENELNTFQHYRIISLAGQVLLSGKANTGRFGFDASALKTGVYILQLTGNENAAVKIYLP